MEETDLHLHPGGCLESMLFEIEEAKDAKLRKVTLYNLEVSCPLAKSIVDLLKVQLQRRHSSSVSSKRSRFTLEILGGKGCIDRIVEAYAAPTFGIINRDNAEGENLNDTRRQQHTIRNLTLQHNHADGFDASVFAALGMALDGRIDKGKDTLGDLRLSLYQPDMSEAKMWTLAQGIQESRHLRELDFSPCTFAPLNVNNTIRYLAEGLKRNKHLVSLELKNCKLADEQIVCLTESLRGHPSLERLDVSGNRCRSKGLISLATSLSSTTKAVESGRSLPLSIDLSNQNIGNGAQTLFNDAVQQEWSRYPSFTDRLANLNLGWNKLDDADLQIIAPLLFRYDNDQQCSSPIKDLSLAGSNFSDQGISCLVDAIQSYRLNASGNFGRTWKSLDLSHQRLTENALQQIAVAMKTNVVLEDIYCRRIPSSASFASIQFYKLLNKGGRQVLNQPDTSFPLSLWPALLGRVNQRKEWGPEVHNQQNARLNILYHLLQEGSVLKER